MRTRKRLPAGSGESHPDERWVVSYADMVTVLMCLFIVLYAMSTVDQNKFNALKNSLATGFGVTASKTVDTADGTVVPKDLVDKNGQGFTATAIAAKVKRQDQALKSELETALKRAGLSAKAEVTVSARGVTIGLVGSATYFDGNSADLRAEAMRVLAALAPALSGEDRTITVEGHADPHGSPGEYGTDWNLAAARATSVLVYLVDHGDIAGSRISSVSYGSARPVTDMSSASIEQNRRVDIVVHRPATTTAAG
ncbi:MAG: chemotaxis protein MotB [Microbacteriaceae bacterium]|nr:chemotaxis protein MotB [Microbacteriaceae bacterium]